MTTVESIHETQATTHADLFPGSEPKTVRLSLEPDERVAPHRHPDREIVFYAVDGVIELEVADETYEMEAGDVARFDGDQDIAPAAIEAATALIVLAPKSG